MIISIQCCCYKFHFLEMHINWRESKQTLVKKKIGESWFESESDFQPYENMHLGISGRFPSSQQTSAEETNFTLEANFNTNLWFILFKWMKFFVKTNLLWRKKNDTNLIRIWYDFETKYKEFAAGCIFVLWNISPVVVPKWR